MNRSSTTPVTSTKGTLETPVNVESTPSPPPVAASNSKNIWLISAIGALFLAGGTFAYMMYKQYQDDVKKEKIYQSKYQQQKKTKINNSQKDGAAAKNEEENITPSFLRTPQNYQELRRTRIYFDQQDEMVDEQTAMRDPNNYYHKYHMIEVDLMKAQNSYGLDGEEEDDYQIRRELQIVGDKPNTYLPLSANSRNQVEKITLDTFYGDKPIDNAEIFLNSLQKTRTKHLKKVQDRDLFLNGVTLGNEKDQDEMIFNEPMDQADKFAFKGGYMQTSQDEDKGNNSVILDLNPEKYEKPKDYLFFDFFSIYTKNFVQQKKGGKRRRAK